MSWICRQKVVLPYDKSGRDDRNRAKWSVGFPQGVENYVEILRLVVEKTGKVVENKDVFTFEKPVGNRCESRGQWIFRVLKNAEKLPNFYRKGKFPMTNLFHNDKPATFSYNFQLQNSQKALSSNEKMNFYPSEEVNPHQAQIFCGMPEPDPGGGSVYRGIRHHGMGLPSAGGRLYPGLSLPMAGPSGGRGRHGLCVLLR